MSIDVHSHFYFPRYVQMMRGRTSIPRIVLEGGNDRLLIMPEEDTMGLEGRGRPIDSSYWEMEQKIGFMKANGIEGAVLSLGNPWLDFLSPEGAVPLARQLNLDLEKICSENPGSFRGLGVLPLQDISASLSELNHMASLTYVKGAILGTKGAGKGLDDSALDPVWQRAEELGLFFYLHPNYGIGEERFGNFAYTLNFALGFPFETTIAVARLILSGVLERCPWLKLIVSHGGGTIPYLSGRLDGIAKAHGKTPKQKPSEYLRRLYYDVSVYHAPALDCLLAFAGPGRLMFGTDHPFKKGASEMFESLAGLSANDRSMILERNARDLFNF